MQTKCVTKCKVNGKKLDTIALDRCYSELCNLD